MANRERCGHGTWAAVDLLISHGPVLADIAGGRVEDQVAVSVERHALRSLHCQPDAARVGSRRHVEVIFQLSVSAVVEQVDAGVHPAAAHPSEAVQAAPPAAGVITDEIARTAGK